MKVIDLLNMIANGEPLPNEICLECVNSINEHNCYYHFSPIFESYINDDNVLIQNATDLATLLDLEVEIIEEDKKIEKIWFSLYEMERVNKEVLEKIENKINEIIDKINEIGE